MKPYTLEIYATGYTGQNPMIPKTAVRVHRGTLETNRDALSPQMYAVREVEQIKISGARARAREFFAGWQKERRNLA